MIQLDKRKIPFHVGRNLLKNRSEFCLIQKIWYSNKLHLGCFRLLSTKYSLKTAFELGIRNLSKLIGFYEV